MEKTALESAYRDYIAALNAQDWENLRQFVHDDVHHNGRLLGIAGYRGMLEQNYAQIPDLHFEIELLVADPPHIAGRLRFNVTPKADFLSLPINGRKVTFCENVFYEYRDGRILHVWSIIDKIAIEAQLRSGTR